MLDVYLGSCLQGEGSLQQTQWLNHPHQSGEASSSSATIHTLCTGCKKERKPRAFILCLARRDSDEK